MPELMGNARNLLGMCAKAAEGSMDDAQQSALAAQVVGAFAAVPVIGGNVVQLVRKRDWYGVVGAIGSYIDVSEASSQKTEVSACSSASASASVDLSVVFGAEDALANASGADAETRKELVGLLRELVAAAQRKDAETAADRLRRYLEVGGNVAAVLEWLGPILMQVGAMVA